MLHVSGIHDARMHGERPGLRGNRGARRTGLSRRRVRTRRGGGTSEVSPGAGSTRSSREMPRVRDGCGRCASPSCPLVAVGVDGVRLLQDRLLLGSMLVGFVAVLVGVAAGVDFGLSGARLRAFRLGGRGGRVRLLPRAVRLDLLCRDGRLARLAAHVLRLLVTALVALTLIAAVHEEADDDHGDERDGDYDDDPDDCGAVHGPSSRATAERVAAVPASTQPDSRPADNTPCGRSDRALAPVQSQWLGACARVGGRADAAAQSCTQSATSGRPSGRPSSANSSSCDSVPPFRLSMRARMMARA